MQEYKDGTFGDVKTLEELKELLSDPQEIEKTSAIHFGTEDELQQKKEITAIVKWYGETLLDVHNKLDMIIKHFKIYPIIGEDKERAWWREYIVKIASGVETLILLQKDIFNVFVKIAK